MMFRGYVPGFNSSAATTVPDAKPIIFPRAKNTATALEVEEIGQPPDVRPSSQGGEHRNGKEMLFGGLMTIKRLLAVLEKVHETRSPFVPSMAKLRALVTGIAAQVAKHGEDDDTLAGGAGQMTVVFSEMLRNARNAREWLVLARAMWPDAASYRVPHDLVSRGRLPDGPRVDEHVDDVLAAQDMLKPL